LSIKFELYSFPLCLPFLFITDEFEQSVNQTAAGVSGRGNAQEVVTEA
jgi:hypothetical protein